MTVRLALLVGLGLMAGAVLHRPLEAQVTDTSRVKRDSVTVTKDSVKLAVPIPRGADSLLVDSLAKRDSLKKKPVVPRDTIKAPIAHAELPMDFGIAQRFHWSGDSIASTGALTVADLLARVPGVTTLSAGWIASPTNAAYMGDVRRVRVFYDGVLLDGLDPRGQGVLDLSRVNLWGVEDAVIEQTADEVRVYLRSWRVNNTTPYTRTDVSTGDQQTNLYRGFFGRRFNNGADLQFGAQQYGTTPPSVYGTSNDQLGLIGRVGWANRDWSVDAHVTRTSGQRGAIFGETVGDSISTVPASRSDSYVRVGYHDPDTSRVWGQVMAVASSFKYTGIKTLFQPAVNKLFVQSAGSLDTNIFQSQYVFTGGTTRGPLRLSATERLFASRGSHVSSPSARASLALGRLAVSAFVEGKGVDSASHSDVTAQFSPLSFVSFLGSVGRSSDSRVADSSFSASYVRAEAGLRVRNVWLVAGMMRRDSVRLSPPHVFDTLFVPAYEPTATGVTAGVHGQIYRLLRADLSAVRWNDSLGYYRPRYETRSELSARTNLLTKFPTNDFGLLGSVVHEYRSGVRYPLANGAVLSVPGYRIISTLIEIRILRATITWQFRNLLGEKYSQVPSFVMPRQTNFYGVRWYFFD
ncbi:MAG TPA: Plug domain-containing protein [Gemmatimonadaceae bacterium]